jgi:hypothetical protein
MYSIICQIGSVKQPSLPLTSNLSPIGPLNEIASHLEAMNQDFGSTTTGNFELTIVVEAVTNLRLTVVCS